MASTPSFGLVTLPPLAQELAQQWTAAIAGVDWANVDALALLNGVPTSAAGAISEWTISVPSKAGGTNTVFSLKGSGIYYNLFGFFGGVNAASIEANVFGQVTTFSVTRGGVDVAPPLSLISTPAGQIAATVYGDLTDADQVAGQPTIDYIFSRLDLSSGSGAAAIVTGVVDNYGLIKGAVASGARTDDRTPTINGTVSAALAAGETVRVFNGSTELGSAVVTGTTWTFTPSAALPTTAGTTYAITARVADAAGNLGPASAARTFVLDTTASTTTAAITSVTDNIGTITGVVANGGRTDDRTPTISGTVSAVLAAGETLRIYNGTRLLGSAVVNNTAKTWTFTPSTLPTSTGATYRITARVADAAGNLGPASTARTFVLDTSTVFATSSTTLTGTQRDLTLTGSKRLNGVGNALDNTIIGNSGNNRLFGLDGKDVLTGGGTGDSDVFGYGSLSESLLSGFDVITDFKRNDRILAPLSVESQRLTASRGVAASLAAVDIASVLSSSAFAANSVAAFTVAGQGGTFIAMNNADAGFQASSDALILLRGYTISSTNFVEFI